jgi:tripartite-type tricarboxylate transporter receptor subunit TctC
MTSKKLTTAFCLLAVIGILGFGLGDTAQAQEWPIRPISMIVSYSPGGATDFQARIVSMMAGDEKYLGQPIVIVNKAGAGGQVGWNWLIERGDKNGYDMTAYNVPHFIAQSIVYKTRFNVDSFEPVANWGADPAVFIVPRDSPFNSLKDAVEYAKANPGRITVTGAGMFVGHHIAFLQMSHACGIQMTYIPEPGGVNALQSVVGGQVMAGFNNLADAYRNQERLKILGIADLQRHEYLPNVPTFLESGYDVNDASVNFRGIAFPKGVPQKVIDKASEVIPKMFEDKNTAAKMKESGSPQRTMTREEVIAMFKEREVYLRELLKDLKQ